MTGGYLFVHFKGNQETPDDEQVYFALSRDAYDWHNLNGGKPVLRSVLGEGGVRDPHIIRAEDGRFFIIATDLYIFGKWGETRDGWHRCQREGSRKIMIWESRDLVNWSDQREAEIAADDATCAWAPECIYDDEAGDYFVYWSSRVKSDGCEKHRVYCAHTRDFVTFSEPKIYIERDFDVIDTTMIKANGKYYRLTKNHAETTIFLESGERCEGEFLPIKPFSLSNERGYEGPTMFKFNGEEKWAVLLDAFATSEGYQMFATSDLDTGETLREKRFATPDPFRHGTVLPINDEEYSRLVHKYGVEN